MTSFVSGWRSELEDRDYLHAPGKFLLRSPIVDAPDVFDPRDWLKVENQLQQGACAGHALTSVMEVCNWIQTRGTIVQLCRQFAYIEGQRVDGLVGQDQGATISGVVKAAKTVGVCREELFPYTGQYVTRFPAACYDEAKNHRAVNHQPLTSYDDCRDWMLAGQGAIEIGIPWTEGLANNKSGRITVSNSGGRNFGGHALGFVGWITDAGSPWMILVNSHDVEWGDRGFALCEPAWIDRQSRGQMNEFIGVSHLSNDIGTPQNLDWSKSIWTPGAVT